MNFPEPESRLTVCLAAIDTSGKCGSMTGDLTKEGEGEEDGPATDQLPALSLRRARLETAQPPMAAYPAAIAV